MSTDSGALWPTGISRPILSACRKFALEYQCADHAEVSRMRRDITRNADLRRDGWLCYLYGPAEVFGRPWEITAEVRVALARRAPELLNSRHRPRVVT